MALFLILPPGQQVVAATQTFGDRINLHPHLHFLVTEGGTDEAALRLHS
ncbi:MAG: transposase [Candidatus Aminicenantes bacterium]|nr:transposase [Candidatus Aminicenantes bacterium]